MPITKRTVTKVSVTIKKTYYESGPLTKEEAIECVQEELAKRERLLAQAVEVILGRVKLSDVSPSLYNFIKKVYSSPPGTYSVKNVTRSNMEGKNRKRGLLLR